MSDVKYILELRPLASEVPAILRLRRLLKIALRSCRLRCVDVKEINVSDDEVVEVER